MSVRDHTGELLHRWHAGDRSALEALLARDLPWVRTEVERRMGGELRQRVDRDDVDACSPASSAAAA